MSVRFLAYTLCCWPNFLQSQNAIACKEATGELCKVCTSRVEFRNKRHSKAVANLKLNINLNLFANANCSSDENPNYNSHLGSPDHRYRKAVQRKCRQEGEILLSLSCCTLSKQGRRSSKHAEISIWFEQLIAVPHYASHSASGDILNTSTVMPSRVQLSRRHSSSLHLTRNFWFLPVPLCSMMVSISHLQWLMKSIMLEAAQTLNSPRERQIRRCFISASHCIINPSLTLSLAICFYSSASAESRSVLWHALEQYYNVGLWCV